MARDATHRRSCMSRSCMSQSRRDEPQNLTMSLRLQKRYQLFSEKRECVGRHQPWPTRPNPGCRWQAKPEITGLSDPRYQVSGLLRKLQVDFMGRRRSPTAGHERKTSKGGKRGRKPCYIFNVEQFTAGRGRIPTML